MRRSDAPVYTREEERGIRAAEFAWDLVIQLSALREARGISQEELARRVGTKQQAISRLENPAYDRQSLAKLREVAAALDAFVDVVLVPREKSDVYLEYRYQPALDSEPPFQWVEVGSGSSGQVDVQVTHGKEQAGAWYSSAPWNDERTASRAHGPGEPGLGTDTGLAIREAA